jgi:hypothetical protein
MQCFIDRCLSFFFWPLCCLLWLTDFDFPIGIFKILLRQKRWFQLPIANFLFICSNIPAAFVFYHDFLEKWLLLTQQLQNHGFQVTHLVGHRHVLVDHRYALFIVITIPSFFPCEWLITRIWTRVIPCMLLAIVQNLSFVNSWVHRLF